LVFEDIFAVERLDFGEEPREARYVRMGAANGVLLMVVYTE